MERINRYLLAILLVLGLCACGQNTQTTWQEQYDLGVRYLSEGNYEEAVIAFTAAIEIDPKRSEAYMGRGEAFLGAGETEDAIRRALMDYQTAVELDETLLDAWLGIVDMHLKLGDHDQAIATLERAIEKAGDSEQLQNRLNELQSETGAPGPFASDPNVFVYEMGANLYLTEDVYSTTHVNGAEIDDLYVYVNFSKDAPNETGYLQFSGTWADGIARYINWGNASSLEIAADSLEESLTSERMEIVESNQMMSAQFDVGLGLDSAQQMPFIYVSGIDANGTADSGVLLTITLTPEIMEKINMLREYIYQ